MQGAKLDMRSGARLTRDKTPAIKNHNLKIENQKSKIDGKKFINKIQRL